jgi:hypothetical protein
MTILFSSIVLLISSCVTMTLAIPSVLVYTRTAGECGFNGSFLAPSSFASAGMPPQSSQFTEP